MNLPTKSKDGTLSMGAQAELGDLIEQYVYDMKELLDIAKFLRGE
jgi:hypothetical protein